MWPTLFRIPLPEFLQSFLNSLFHPAPGQEITSIPIHSFGVMVMTGFLVGLWWATRLARKYGSDTQNDPEKISDLAFWILIGVLAGGRLFFVMQNYSLFQDNPFRILAFWEGGMVFYGGFLLSLWLGLRHAKKVGLDPWATADYMLVAGMLGYGIGRFGCLLVGDDYGSETTMPWALHVPDPLPKDSLFPPELAGHSIHPAQIYMAMNGFLIAAIGAWMLKRKKFKGQVAGMVLILYAVGRFLIEFFRGDADRGFYGPLSTSQWIGVLIIVIVAPILWSRYQGLKTNPVSH